MHEVGLMANALEIALNHAQKQKATQVHRIGMRIGALAGVEPDALQFAFEALKRDTPAREAALEVEYVSLRVACRACAQEFAPEGYRYDCPFCGSTQTEVIAGRELDVVSVEMSVEGDEDEPG